MRLNLSTVALNDTKFKVEASSWFLASILLLYVFVAYMNSGYNHEDEHYQIIEFANYKLGLISADSLAWEFSSKIRPGLHPFFCFLLLKIFSFFGISDGYTIAFFLRVITAITSVFVIRSFINVYKRRIVKKMIPWFVILSYCLWFLPYINVRFSSETWAGLSLLLALVFIERDRYEDGVWKFIKIGLLLGIAILFRFQSGLFAVGIIAWFVFVSKQNIKNLVILILSILFILLCGVIIDTWLYGEFVLSFVNYFKVNLIQGVSSNFGTSPWYMYIYFAYASPGPIGIFIIMAFAVTIYKYPKNLIIWAILPFLIVHSIIPHKELRFLYPVANLLPFILISAFQEAKLDFIPNLNHRKLLVNLVISTTIIVNVIGLIAVGSTGAGKAQTSLAEYIHKNYSSDQIQIILVGDITPYIDSQTLKNTYYNSSNLAISKVSSIWHKDFLIHKKHGVKNLVVLADSEISGPRAVELLNKSGLRRVYRTIPLFLTLIYNVYDPTFNENGMSLYEIDE